MEKREPFRRLLAAADTTGVSETDPLSKRKHVMTPNQRWADTHPVRIELLKDTKGRVGDFAG